MANYRNSTNNENRLREITDMPFTVSAVRQVGKNVFFTLTLNNAIVLNDYRAVTGKDGRTFISPAQDFSEKAGRWFSRYYVRLSDSMQTKVLAEVMQQLQGQASMDDLHAEVTAMPF